MEFNHFTENFLSAFRRVVEEKNENIIRVILIISVTLFFFAFLFVRAPREFPINHIVGIQEGSSLDQIIGTLEKENVIRSPFWFKVFAYFSFNQNDLVAGDYVFRRKSGLFSVLSRLSSGEYGVFPESIVLHEGTTVKEMATALKNKFPDFDDKTFVKLAQEKEGFLFPDTYKFLPNVGPRQVIRALEDNFKNQVLSLEEEIELSGHSLKEVVIMASILEEEARTQESREMISGILWKRINIGMPLQVDAVFPYIIGKNTFELTFADLEVDSPYNTYQNLGLPPGAISNPSLSSIVAALRPRENPYLFYLSDLSGNMHYARNFEEHKKNKFLYLR